MSYKQYFSRLKSRRSVSLKAYNTSTYDQSPVYASDVPSSPLVTPHDDSVHSASTERTSVTSERTSVSSGRTSSIPAFEDTLQDYQPPKRYVKEETKQRKGPSVFITDENEVSQSTNRKLSRKISVTDQCPSSANEEEADIPPSLPFGSLLATWSANEGGGAGPDNMCKKCNKRVYEMEKIIADKAIYHKPCFRCVHCHRVLTLGNYAAIDEQPYCKPHFIELFKKKGKYDMGKPKESTAPKKEPVKAAPVEEPRPASPATRVNDSSDEEGEEREEPKKEEPVRYQQMSSVRNMFENVARSNSPQNAAPAPKAKTPSKWDKPKPATPPPRVDTPPSDRDTPPSDGDVTDAPADTQPPAAITRNLVAKFRELEQAEVPVPDRKPVHKITPPRDELAASIAEYEETVAVERTPEPVQEDEEEVVMSGEASSPQGELPPAQLTRQMLARFQSLEDVAASPPSPQQRAPSKRSNVERTPSTSRQTRPARASPDSGIVDVELHAHTDAQTNGHADAQTHGHNETNGLDETNGHADGPLEPEQELPEQGFTRSLLAKWRVIEETSPEAAPPQPIARKDSARSTPRREVAAPEPVYNGRESPAPEEPPREILRESDTKEEDDLPPPSFTRNMLAKFQNLEAEAERQAAETSQPSRKQSFKWTVRSAPLMSRSGMVWEEKQRHLSSADVDDEHFPDDNDNDAQVFYDNDDTAEYEDQSEIVQSGAAAVDGESERPPAEFTRNMLAKFQSFEDVNQPPPSPARAEVQQRKAYASSSSSATNARFSSSTVTMATSDGRYDDSASNDDVDLQEYYHHDADLHGDHDEYDRYGNADVTRETDPGENELPEEGMARNLAAKFTSLQSAA